MDSAAIGAQKCGEAKSKIVPEIYGAWIVYCWDVNACPIALYKDEIDALRHVEKNGYGHVKFWEFNTEWDNKYIPNKSDK